MIGPGTGVKAYLACGVTDMRKGIGGLAAAAQDVLRQDPWDISKMLEFVAAKLKVVETVRPKKSCRRCERIVQTPAPPRPIPRGMAGPGLLAHILVAKYDDHLPLYRQGEILARLGADVPRSTLIDWCGQATAALRPLAERVRRSVLSADRLHADDTPVRVLDPSRRAQGKERGVREGRIWVYVRDDRPWCGGDPPGVAYFFSPDRQGKHTQDHLARFEGVLQADAYAGKPLYEAAAAGGHASPVRTHIYQWLSMRTGAQSSASVRAYLGHSWGRRHSKGGCGIDNRSGSRHCRRVPSRTARTVTIAGALPAYRGALCRAKRN